jgi:hypothetical protein
LNKRWLGVNLSKELILNNTSRDFIQIVSEIETFCHQSSKRSLSNKQKSIILNNQYDTLREAFNKFHSDPTLTLENRTRILFEIVPRLNDLLNLIYSDDLEKIRLKISNIANFGLILMVGPSGEEDLWLHLTSANLIVKILSGVHTYSQVPKFSTFQVPNFYENNGIYLNSLRGIVGIFQGAIISLSNVNISRENCIEWANTAFKHLLYINEYVKSIKLESMAIALKGKEKNIYFGGLIRSQSMSGTFTLSYYLLRMFGDIWPQEINTQNLIKRSLIGLVEFCKYQEYFAFSVIEEIKDLYSRGVINPNESPDKYPHVSNLNLFRNGYKSARNVFETLKNVVDTCIINNTYENYIIEIINNGLLSSQDYRLYLINSGNGIDTYYIHSLIYELSLVMVKSTIQKTIKEFENYLKSINETILLIKTSSNPEFQYTLILTKIKLICELGSVEELFPCIEDLTKLLESLNRRPRLYVTTLILLNIIKNIKDPQSISKNSSEFEKGKLLLQTYGQVHLEEKYLNYVQIIKKAFSSENSKLTYLNNEIPSILKQPINHLDPFTWIKPEFSKFLPENSRYLPWIPFNIEYYAIID